MSPVDEGAIMEVGKVTIDGATEDLRRNRPRYVDLLCTLQAHHWRMTQAFSPTPAQLAFGGRLHTLQIGDIEAAIEALLAMRERLDAVQEGAPF